MRSSNFVPWEDPSLKRSCFGWSNYGFGKKLIINKASIIGLGKACELAKKHLDEENTKVKALRDYLETKLLEKIPNTLVNGDRAHRLPITVSVSFECVDPDVVYAFKQVVSEKIERV